MLVFIGTCLALMIGYLGLLLVVLLKSKGVRSLESWLRYTDQTEHLVIASFAMGLTILLLIIILAGLKLFEVSEQIITITGLGLLAIIIYTGYAWFRGTYPFAHLRRQ